MKSIWDEIYAKMQSDIIRHSAERDMTAISGVAINAKYQASREAEKMHYQREFRIGKVVCLIERILRCKNVG